MEVALQAEVPENSWIGSPTGWPGSEKKEAKLYPNTCVKNGNYTRKYVINSGNLKAVRRVKTWELCRIKI